MPSSNKNTSIQNVRAATILKVLTSAALVLTLLAPGTVARAQSAAHHPEWPGKGQLFVGACYQPVDRTPEEIHRDIAIMKKAGFNLVRMGDLSWDAFEPSQGKFEFAWFDKVMDEMNANGIRVVLDISGLPAPIWLHKKYRGIDLISQDGTRLPPAERYMDNISDPNYRREVVAFADALTKHYAGHPAIIAIGYDNEIGNGFMSYSEADRLRFVDWVKKRYGSIESLNKAWATQRWSRHLNSFNDVDLPLKEGPGPSERYLDLHRYWSDVTISVIEDLETIRDLQTPIWFNEFTAGGPGYYGTPGRSRMWAYVGLIDYAQTILAWTFNSHSGGEEQALFGLVDHDGSPSWKVDEFARIGVEFKKLQSLGFPRDRKPEVAIAYSFESKIASSPNGPSNTTRDYFKTAYSDQVQNAFEPFFRDNIDTAVIHIGHDSLDGYKLVVVAADYMMDQASADAIRGYVKNGGTVIMTAYSAKVDEHGQWFNTPLPGRLSDVFGLKTNAFNNWGSSPLEVHFNEKAARTSINFYEVLEPSTARVIASFTNTPEKSPAITVNSYGKGKAIYLATPAQMSVLQPLVRSLYVPLDIQRGPETSEGVYARVVEGRTLYVNTTGEAKDIVLNGQKVGLISGKTYEGVLHLAPMDADLLQ